MQFLKSWWWLRSLALSYCEMVVYLQGLAYVEFANEAEASQAVLKMDGMVFQDYTISVAISNPPGRNTEASSGKLPRNMPPQQPFGA